MKIKTLQTPYHSLAFTFDYVPEVMRYCKLLQSSWGWQAFSYNATHKAWVFSSPQIVEAITEKFPQTMLEHQVKDLLHITELENLAEEVKLKEMIALKISENSSNSSIEIPGLKGGAKVLYPFQRTGVEFLVRSGARSLLADDPGLGKTVQAIGAMLHLGSPTTLVVCPATMKYTWEAEIEKWSSLTSCVVNSKTKIPKITSQVIVVNYDLLKRHIIELSKIKFGMMILDEAHYIKTSNTIRSRAVRVLSRNVPYIIMLTGTPVLNRPAELFNPLSILDPKKWNNYYRFVYKYCGAHQTRFGLDVSGSSNIEELSRELSSVMLRRRKEEVLKDLPKKVRVDIPVELDKGSLGVYHKAYGSFAKFLKENKGKKDAEVAQALQAEKLVRLNALRQIAGNGKVDSAAEIIRNVIEGGQKIIVFSSFVNPLKSLQDIFGDGCVLLTGQTPAKERFEIVKRFQEDEKIKVFLGGVMSAGVGITLTEASNVLFLDYAWTPAAHKQSEDRAHRIGSRHESITIYQMHAVGTIDDIMKKVLKRKRGVVDKLVGPGDDQSAISMVLDEIIKELN